MTPEFVIALGQFGFAGAMCILIWVGYSKLVPQLLDLNERLMEVVKQNSATMADMAGVVRSNTGNVKALAEDVSSLEMRIGTLETLQQGLSAEHSRQEQQHQRQEDQHADLRAAIVAARKEMVECSRS